MVTKYIFLNKWDPQYPAVPITPMMTEAIIIRGVGGRERKRKCEEENEKDHNNCVWLILP